MPFAVLLVPKTDYLTNLRWTGERGGLPSIGTHRVGHDRRDLAAEASWTWNLHENDPNYLIHTHKLRENCPYIPHFFFFFLKLGIVFGILFPFYSSQTRPWGRIAPSILRVLALSGPAANSSSSSTFLPVCQGAHIMFEEQTLFPSLPLSLFGCLALLYLPHRCLKLRSKILKERIKCKLCFMATCKFISAIKCHWYRIWQLLKFKVLC